MNLTPLLDSVPGATVDDGYGPVTVDVPAETWTAALDLARTALGCDWFDFLTAVDEPDGFAVVCHVARTSPFAHLLLRTRLPHEQPQVGSVSGSFAGAAWHERETAEMFGIRFLDAAGVPLALEPLLLPPGFEGHPLRKDFVLQARVDRAWPGAKDPERS
jgi:NADH:ubiquinone oxidoreductase subunit C